MSKGETGGLDMNLINIENYIAMVNGLMMADYKLKNFTSPVVKEPYVLLRHDIDFCITDALELALIEKDLGISSTYFVMLRSPLYNTLSPFAIEAINKIHHLGHEIALHYDPSPYMDFCEGLLKELALIKIYSSLINSKIVSFHRVGKKAFEYSNIKMPDNIRNTYEPDFFTNISYFSDSGGAWRRGNPIGSEEFKSKKNMQILTHPMWWIEKGNTPIEKLESLLTQHRYENVEFLEKYVLSYPIKSLLA